MSQRCFFLLLFSAVSAFGNAHPESGLGMQGDFVQFEPDMFKRFGTTYQLDTTGYDRYGKLWQPPVDYYKKRHPEELSSLHSHSNPEARAGPCIIVHRVYQGNTTLAKSINNGHDAVPCR